MLPAAAMLIVAAAAPSCAHAQGKLEARYTATLAGLPIGKGNWFIEFTDTNYKAMATGGTTGLVHVFTGGEGTSAVHGTLQAGKPIASLYVSTIKGRKNADVVHINVSNGSITDVKVNPPLNRNPERVPITEANKRDVLDPMTAVLVRMPGNGNALSREACQRTLAIFDGRMRYDLQLAFKRMDTVKAEKGYSGPVVVCAVYFSPIAGYIPSRTTIKYLSKQRDMEIWLAPISGTRVLVPYRVQGPTPIGEAVLMATEFVTTALPTRASANGVKTP